MTSKHPAYTEIWLLLLAAFTIAGCSLYPAQQQPQPQPAAPARTAPTSPPQLPEPQTTHQAKRQTLKAKLTAAAKFSRHSPNEILLVCGKNKRHVKIVPSKNDKTAWLTFKDSNETEKLKNTRPAGGIEYMGNHWTYRQKADEHALYKGKISLHCTYLPSSPLKRTP